MEATHITSNPRGGKLGTVNEKDDNNGLDISATTVAILSLLKKATVVLYII